MIVSPLWSHTNSKTLRSTSLSLSPSLFSTNTRTYLYMSVCVEREPPLLTGNPGYCNLPRLDSTCLSAVWYRVGHCCNWSRNAIALLIIEIINGPRYRVGSYSKYLDKSRYLGAKEDVSRCSSSFECTRTYTYTRVPSWLSLWSCLYNILMYLFILLLLSAKVRIYFFFFYLCFSLIARVSDSHPDTF